MFDFSSQLNPSQLEAVQHMDGPSLVIAGAGSGKTRVLTYKIAYLLQQGVMPWNILALTFTNKAAREMNNRIADIVGTEATRNLWSGTFHSIFARILRRESQYMGYSPDFTIYDTSDSRSLIKTLVKEMQLDDKGYKASVVQNRISEAKNLLMLPEQYAADASLYKRDSINNVPKVRDIYAAYQERCRKANAMDFDDLLLNTYLLFRRHPEVCEHYRNRFVHILVDEYQDTNSAQHAIIRQLTHPQSCICVVGDDAQSIYGFRGANIDNILKFTTQYPTAKVIKLERNYRSTQTIVNAANCIIRGNLHQIEKTIYSENEVGEKLRVFETQGDKDEAEKVAGEIRRLVRREGTDYEDIALLYRTNAQSRVFEETFRLHAIPYRIWGGLSFYQRKEIKDVIAYLRMLANPHDEEAFKRIINTPARGIGNTTLSKIMMAAAEHGVSPWEVLCSTETYGLSLGKSAQTRLDGFQYLIVSGMEMAATESAYEVARHMVKASGIWADISVDNSPENLSRRENVEELLNSIKSYEEDVLETEGRKLVPLTEFLSQVALLTDADERDDGTPKVTLMTVHAAKGLEFDTVFVTGLEEDLFPNEQARVFPREMEEERRLFYVAVTRAEHRCYLSFAKSRFRYGKLEFANESCFIREIDDRYLQRDANPYRQWGGTARRSSDDDFFMRREDRKSYNTSSSMSPATPRPSVSRVPSRTNVSAPSPSAGANTRPAGTWRKVTPSASASATSAPQSLSVGGGTLKVGSCIAHERFGRGRVLSLEGSGESAKACVEFENAGTKTLLLKFARFRVL